MLVPLLLDSITGYVYQSPTSISIQPCDYYYYNTASIPALSIAPGSSSIVVYNTPVIANLSGYDPATGEFIPLVGGSYRYRYEIAISSSFSGSLTFAVVNGNTTINSIAYPLSGVVTNPPSVTISGIVTLTTSDNLYSTLTSGGTNTITVSTANSSVKITQL